MPVLNGIMLQYQRRRFEQNVAYEGSLHTIYVHCFQPITMEVKRTLDLTLDQNTEKGKKLFT